MLLFPKFYRDLPLDDLAALVRDVGLDGIALPVREGFWAPPATLAADLPTVVAGLRRHGLTCDYAIVGADAARLAADTELLRVLAGNGVRRVRFGYFDAGADPRAAIARARDDLARLAEAAAAAGVQAILQVHHGRLIAAPSLAWQLVAGLPPAALGVKLDPGNQAFEGWEDPRTSMRLLGGHLAAVGVKDVAVARDPALADRPGKGWTRRFVPITEGMIDWTGYARLLVAAGFAGPFVFHPFYHEHDAALRTRCLADEVRHLRAAVAAARAATAGADP